MPHKTAEARKEYNEKNKEAIAAYYKEYREKNKEARKEYYEKNKEAIAAKSKEYREKNKEAMRAYNKEYREKNKEALRAYKKKYNEKNKEAIAAYKKEYREKNKEAIKKYNEKNKEAIAANNKEYYVKQITNMDNHSFFLRRYQVYRRKSKNLNMDFNIDASYLKEIFPTDKKCPALGMPFKVGYEGGVSNSPSLDRIDNSKGYIKGNVVWVSMLANTIKTSATPEQIIRVGEFYKQLDEDNTFMENDNDG